MDSKNSHKFIETSKKVTSPDLLQKFLISNTYKIIVDFITQLQESMIGKTITSVKVSKNPCVLGLVNLLDKLEKMSDETPVQKSEQRFGNTAFKVFIEKISKDYDNIIGLALQPTPNKELGLELKNYLLNSFGSNMRLDYGTGHELNFLCILLVLFCVGYYSKDDFESVVTHVFFKYIFLARKIQIHYQLEPAGAHGVWGLDEYQFLPFLFGAAQLIGNNEISPSNSIEDSIVDQYSQDYMYLNCIKHIKSVKHGGPFGEYAPLLYNMTAVKNWEKIAKGLIKMYEDEVLKKYVVIQHFFFGSILTYG